MKSNAPQPPLNLRGGKNERMALLLRAVNEKGQAQVARELGYSASALNQVLKGSYKGELNNLLRRVAEVYGAETVNCPVMGDISLGRCAEEKKKPFSASSPLRVRLFKACRECGA